MRINGAPWRTIWVEDDGTVAIIDQTRLPHALVVEPLRGLADAVAAIDSMQVRGAPLIGATAAYGMALAMADDPGDAALRHAADALLASRPTAVNLRWAVEKLHDGLQKTPPAQRPARAMAMAADICECDVAVCESIGRHGLELIRAIAAGKREGEAVNILTHCNAGWLATVDWGTATAPVYKAHAAGIPLHVWVDETRPRNQGASLTAFELGAEGIAHSLIVDNAGGHLMQQGLVDLCIVGTDRTTAAGDVANKIGTYLKALAAHDNGVPFYVALPSSTIDWRIEDGLRDIPIEERSSREVTHISGLLEGGDVATVALAPPQTGARNPAFDVTPARLVSGLITERGVIGASRAALAAAFPEMVQKGHPG